MLDENTNGGRAAMRASWFAMIVIGAAGLRAQAQTAPAPDTIRLEVGSKQLNGKVFAPHAARVRVRTGEGAGRVTAEWTNELTHGDSAGRPVHRWVNKGTRTAPTGTTVTWELQQTYDAETRSEEHTSELQSPCN